MVDIYDRINFDNPDGGVWKQGWTIEMNPNEWNDMYKLKVFVVPHSHNDPGMKLELALVNSGFLFVLFFTFSGWIKTFDEYYEQTTKSILTNMLHQLNENAGMTFIWAEISYFSQWYESLKPEHQLIVKK